VCCTRIEAMRENGYQALRDEVESELLQRYVKAIDNKVVLIDGAALAALLFDYGVGVSEAKRYTVKRIDSDYFEE